MKNCVVIPYYCEEEVERFLWTADLLATFPRATADVEFILAASPYIDPSERLRAAFGRIGRTEHLRCNQHGRSHYEGSLSMFWDAMEFVHSHREVDKGFALWLESDMVPVREDWLDLLTADWTANGDLAVMGLFADRLPDYLGGVSVPEHINGGACYSKRLVELVPPEERFAPFDVSILPAIRKRDVAYLASQRFAFSTIAMARDQIQSQGKAILHGLCQPKDSFVQCCIQIAMGHAPFLERFDGEFKHKLSGLPIPRIEGFESIFTWLDSRRGEPLIVETGCVRQDGWIDGRATVLFDQFVQRVGGQVVSVDLSEDSCRYARSQVSARTAIVHSDSVPYLAQVARESPSSIDLLYLDSFDVSWEDPHPSALHHFKELCAAMPALKRGALVVVDDHMGTADLIGKSKYIAEFMASIGARKLFEAYQIGWIMP